MSDAENKFFEAIENPPAPTAELIKLLRDHAMLRHDDHTVCDEAADEIERLRARVAELEAAQEWRPIESAPRDGRRVLCWSEKWDAPESGGPYFLPRLGGVGWASGRLAMEKGGWLHQPTHWLPLPAPPKVAT